MKFAVEHEKPRDRHVLVHEVIKIWLPMKWPVHHRTVVLCCSNEREGLSTILEHAGVLWMQPDWFGESSRRCKKQNGEKRKRESHGARLS